MGKEDREDPKASLTAEAIGNAIGQAMAAAIPQIIAATQNASLLSGEQLAAAVGRAIKAEINPTTEDRLKMLAERPPGEARTVVDGISPHTQAKFKAVLRPDGTCERLDDYEYPVFVWPEKYNPYQVDQFGQPTTHYTQEAKQRIYQECYLVDMKAFVGRTKKFPAEARADMAPRLAALRSEIEAETARLVAEHDAKLASLATVPTDAG